MSTGLCTCSVSIYVISLPAGQFLPKGNFLYMDDGERHENATNKTLEMARAVQGNIREMADTWSFQGYERNRDGATPPNMQQPRISKHYPHSSYPSRPTPLSIDIDITESRYKQCCITTANQHNPTRPRRNQSSSRWQETPEPHHMVKHCDRSPAPTRSQNDRQIDNTNTETRRTEGKPRIPNAIRGYAHSKRKQRNTTRNTEHRLSRNHETTSTSSEHIANNNLKHLVSKSYQMATYGF
jgi:hypothetical protein